MPITDTRLTFQIATVKLEAAELTEADLRAPAAEFARLTHANERCRAEKMFVHKVRCGIQFLDGSGQEGLMQSAIFDIDKSNGKQELRELCDAVKETIIEAFYPDEKRRIVTPDA